MIFTNFNVCNVRRKQSVTMKVFNLNILYLHLFLMNCVVILTNSSFSDINFSLMKRFTGLGCVRNI